MRGLSWPTATGHQRARMRRPVVTDGPVTGYLRPRSEEHTSELQSPVHLLSSPTRRSSDLYWWAEGYDMMLSEEDLQATIWQHAASGPRDAICPGSCVDFLGRRQRATSGPGCGGLWSPTVR